MQEEPGTSPAEPLVPDTLVGSRRWPGGLCGRDTTSTQYPVPSQLPPLHLLPRGHALLRKAPLSPLEVEDTEPKSGCYMPRVPGHELACGSWGPQLRAQLGDIYRTPRGPWGSWAEHSPLPRTGGRGARHPARWVPHVTLLSTCPRGGEMTLVPVHFLGSGAVPPQRARCTWGASRGSQSPCSGPAGWGAVGRETVARGGCS